MTSIPGIFRALGRARVRYLLVGGYASVVHGVPRTTLDVDLALDPKPANVGRALRALRRIGLEPETDRLDEILVQGGVTAAGDRSVDLLTSLPGLAFEDLWPRRVITRFRGTRIYVISREDQIRILRRTGRPQDLEDAAVLEALGEEP